MHQDQVIESIIKCLVKHQIKGKAYLFGSRARGDFQPQSDYDVGIESTALNHEKWAILCDEIRTQSPTIHGLDLVWMDVAAQKLVQKILSEGILNYDK